MQYISKNSGELYVVISNYEIAGYMYDGDSTSFYFEDILYVASSIEQCLNWIHSKDPKIYLDIDDEDEFSDEPVSGSPENFAMQIERFSPIAPKRQVQAIFHPNLAKNSWVLHYNNTNFSLAELGQ